MNIASVTEEVDFHDTIEQKHNYIYNEATVICVHLLRAHRKSTCRCVVAISRSYL